MLYGPLGLHPPGGAWSVSTFQGIKGFRGINGFLPLRGPLHLFHGPLTPFQARSAAGTGAAFEAPEFPSMVPKSTALSLGRRRVGRSGCPSSLPLRAGRRPVRPPLADAQNGDFGSRGRATGTVHRAAGPDPARAPARAGTRAGHADHGQHAARQTAPQRPPDGPP